VTACSDYSVPLLLAARGGRPGTPPGHCSRTASEAAAALAMLPPSAVVLPLPSSVPERGSEGSVPCAEVQRCYGLYTHLGTGLRFSPSPCSAIKPEKSFNCQASTHA